MANFAEILNHSDFSEDIHNRNCPRTVNSKLFSTSVSGNTTDFILIKYSNRIFITVTESKKVGNLYSIQLNSPQRNGLCTQAPAIFDVKCILGADTEEKIVAVRALVEKLGLTQPILLSLTITNFDYSTISTIAEAILSNKCW